MTTTPEADRRTHLATRAAIAVAVAFLIGAPLFGIGAFAGTDLLERFDPWSTSAPDLPGTDNILRGDEIDTRLPARRQIADGLRSGELDLWQSEVNGGRPLAAVPNTASLSAMNAPYWFLPTRIAPAITKLLEVAIAMLGTTLLLRSQGARREVGLLGGFLVGFGGYQVVWTGWPHAPLVALFPLLLWSVSYALEQRTVSAHAPLVLLVATGWLQGFPAVSMVGLLLAGLWGLWSVVGTQTIAGAARRLAGLAGAVVLGTGLAAFQLATFLAQLGGVDTGERAQTVLDHLPLDHLLTLGLPFVFGDDASWSGVDNLAESHSWLGIVALVLLGLWAWHGSPAPARRLGSFLTTVATVIGSMIWMGGLPLALGQRTPLLSINAVARLRGFVLVSLVLLAALGLEHHLRKDRVDPGVGRWLRLGALGLLAVAAATGLPDAVTAARLAGRGAELQLDLAILVVGVAVVGAILWQAGRRAAIAALLVPALVLIAAADTKRLTAEVWSDVPTEAFYPPTAAHDFLVDVVGDDRTASAERALYPGTTTWYGIRTSAGHAFPDPAWREALLAIDPAAYVGSATQPLLSPTPEVARSPLLDRMATRWWITDLDHPPIGAPATLTLAIEGQHLTAALASPLPFRSVVLPSTAGLVNAATTVTTEVLDGGVMVATSTRRLLPTRLERPVVLSVPETVGDQLRVTWSGTEIPLSAVGRHPATHAPTDDPLRLAFTDGVLAYERQAALPRFRWASQSVTIADGGHRLAALSSGDVPDDTVVLHQEPPVDHTPGANGVADIEAVVPDGDVLELHVAASESGWLVVADSLQRDWLATVDGDDVSLLEADHVGVAIALAPGTHEVVLRYAPTSLRVGAIVTAATALFATSLLLWPLWRRRRQAP